MCRCRGRLPPISTAITIGLSSSGSGCTTGSKTAAGLRLGRFSFMKIDVSVSCENGQLHTRSRVADFSDDSPSNMVTSTCLDGTFLVEAIGEPFDVEMRTAAWERDKGSRTYNSFDPFAIDRFEPEPASMVLFHLCHRAHGNLKPKRGMWRTLLGLDKFLLTVRIPYYSRVPLEKREAFERHLRKRIGPFAVGD